MRFALVGENRREAAPQLKGSCVGCGQPMIAKCGKVKIHHWAHKGKRVCDPWWENETSWHRNWKNQFPEDWQEFREVDAAGEAHIADVKTPDGIVVEFQHSRIAPDEVQARNQFYKKIFWVVDGLRRLEDKSKFLDALKYPVPSSSEPTTDEVQLVRSMKSPLLREWGGCAGPVFFDFGKEGPLWCLLPKTKLGRRYVKEFSHSDFIAIHSSVDTLNDFRELFRKWLIAARSHCSDLTVWEDQKVLHERRRAELYKVYDYSKEGRKKW